MNIFWLGRLTINKQNEYVLIEIERFLLNLEIYSFDRIYLYWSYTHREETFCYCLYDLSVRVCKFFADFYLLFQNQTNFVQSIIRYTV